MDFSHTILLSKNNLIEINKKISAFILNGQFYEIMFLLKYTINNSDLIDLSILKTINMCIWCIIYKGKFNKSMIVLYGELIKKIDDKK